MSKQKITLVIPCFNEQESLPIFYKEISKVLHSMECDYELIFIDDGSNDDTLKLLRKFGENDKNLKYVSFSRNFGKEAAMYAGFQNVDGDYVAVMDADMQDPPSLLPKMLKILCTQNYDCVATRRISRKGEPHIRSWFAKKFYKLINKISDADIMDGARDFRLMKRKMVDSIVAMDEYNRFSKGIFGWIGFNTYWLEYENVARVAGKTKWSFGNLIKYALDGIINFSEVPLNMASWLGIVMTFLSFVFLVAIIVRKLIFNNSVDGWASLVCIIVFVSGIQLLCMGIIGKYIAKIYMETKHRPHYIIKDSNIDISEK